MQGTCEGVTVVEVTGRGLCLLWSKGTSIEWVFEITTIVSVSVCVCGGGGGLATSVVQK